MQDKQKQDNEELETITFNLSIENIAWLKRVNEKMQRKSVSNTLNYILSAIRLNKHSGMTYEA